MRRNVINTPAKIDIRSVYSSIAARIPAGDEQIAFSRRTFSTWMMMDDIATSKATITALWYRVAGSPFVVSHDEARNILTVDKHRLDVTRGVNKNKKTNTANGVCVHPTGDRYIILDDHEEVRE